MESETTFHLQQTDNPVQEIDPDPITIILELANLVFQPGSLAILASAAAGAVTSGIMTYKALSARKKADIRKKLFEIDRALTKGFAGLSTLASFLDEYHYIKEEMVIGGAPIRGHNNAQTLRRVHEDCRSAVKDARDAFMDLSALLPIESGGIISQTLNELNELAEPLLRFRKPYGIFLVTAALALTKVDELICRLGERYQFKKLPRDFSSELRKSLPNLEKYKH